SAWYFVAWILVEGRSQRSVAREFGLARVTVRKMLGYSIPPGYRRKEPAKRYGNFIAMVSVRRRSRAGSISGAPRCAVFCGKGFDHDQPVHGVPQDLDRTVCGDRTYPRALRVEKRLGLSDRREAVHLRDG